MAEYNDNNIIFTGEGAEYYFTNIIDHPFDLVGGKTYLLSFDASSEDTIIVGLWSLVNGEAVLLITPESVPSGGNEKRTVEITIDSQYYDLMDREGYSGCGLYFSGNGFSGTIDNVSLKELLNDSENVLIRSISINGHYVKQN